MENKEARLTAKNEKSPDSFGEELGARESVSALPKRISRYALAKVNALTVVEYMRSLENSQVDPKLFNRVSTCGDYLLFRHYYTVDKVKLHAASLCAKHLLCQLCAIRRGARFLAAYLDKFTTLKAQKPALNAFMVTLTVKDGLDLKERFEHLKKGLQTFFKNRSRGRGSWLDAVQGAVWSYEFKRGKNSGAWHPHLHMIALADSDISTFESSRRLSEEWKNITKDSFIVDVRPISQDDPASGFLEVFKYAVKFTEQAPEDTYHAFKVLSGKNLLASSGIFRGVELPENLVDEPLENLPFVYLFYKFLGSGYSLQT
jgi:plasmid rolling circle replication initiator protein Rep